MNKYVIFREMLDYLAHISEVVDADMNTYHGGLLIVGETSDQTITIDITIKDKEVNQDAEELE